MFIKRINVLKPVFIIAIVILGLQSLHAQQFNFNDYVPASPKSPNAAALGQYGDVPVSLYTGVPDIQIPIYNIQVGKFSVPISLSYHASGVKVEDYGSWVGTGWALNTGGTINRQKMGMLDEGMIDSYTSFTSQINTIVSGGQAGINSNASTGAAGQMGVSRYDTAPDIFSYSFPSGSGKFYMEPTGNIYTVPANKLKIQQSGRVSVPNGYSAFQQWTITDEQGIKYVYNDREVTGINSQNPPPPGINTWYLSSITLPNGQSINYTYEQYSYTVPINYSYTSYLFQPFYNFPQNYSEISYLTTLRLTAITFPGGKINFVAGGYRADLPMDKVLDHIDIYDQSNKLLREYKMSTNNPTNIAPQQLTNNSSSFRLNLQSVTMYDGNLQNIGAYNMQYNQALPAVPRNSMAQDFWGYYNGQVTNGNLIPVTNFTLNGQAYTAGTANRAVDAASCQLDILQSIQYPTGGTTNFTFESNQAVVNDSRINGFFGSPTSNPVQRSTNFTLENTTAGNNSAFGPEFTIGNVNYNTVRFQYSSHILPYTNNTCNDVSQPYPGGGPNAVAYKNSCYQVNLLQKQANGTFTTAYSDLFYPATYALTGNTTYKFQIIFRGQGQGMAYATLMWNETPVATDLSSTPFLVGGLRIKKIQSVDPVTNSTLTKTYSYVIEPNQCSGTIAALPVYLYITPADVVDGVLYLGGIITVTSQSQSPMFNTSASGIGYSSVIEYSDDNGTLGKNVYTYTSNNLTQPGAYPDAGLIESFQFPFTPPCSYEWRRGKLLSKYSYVNNNGVYQPVSTTDNTYIFLNQPDQNYRLSNNIQIYPMPAFQYVGGSYIKGNTFLPKLYNSATEAFFTSNTISKVYDSQGNQTNVTQSANNTFDSATLQNSGVASTVSNGNTNSTQFEYALDYSNLSLASDNASLGIKNLVTLNMGNTPVEELSVVKNPAGQSFVTGGVLLVYYQDKPLINQYYKLAVTAPIPLASFVASYINSSGQFVHDSRYELNTSIDAYTPGFNASQVTKSMAPSMAYLWGYNYQYVVASASNAKSNDIFYDSFEEGDGNSTFGDAKTGHYSYTAGVSAYTKALSGLDAGAYTYSYWYYQSGSWLLQTGSATVPVSGNYTITIPAGTKFDDLRFYPAGAQITTYTYDPLIGMNSSSDPKGEVSYYEYDSFQRLKNVRDKDNNILKNYCYNYAGQQTGCPINVGNAAKMGTFNKACSPGSVGSSVTYTVPANSYFAATQTLADQLAQNDVNTNGQNYANANGTCTVVTSPYVVMTLATSVVDANGHTQNTYTFTAYADAANTQLFAVAGNLTVNYKITTTVTHSSGSPGPATTNTNQTIVIPAGANHATTGQIDVYHCTGGSNPAVVQQSASVKSVQSSQAVASPNVVQPGDTICTSSTVTLLAGTGYQIGGGLE